jgi:hypothetical protein
MFNSVRISPEDTAPAALKDTPARANLGSDHRAHCSTDGRSTLDCAFRGYLTEWLPSSVLRRTHAVLNLRGWRPSWRWQKCRQ